MTPKKLKEVMLNFLNKKIDILLCTTIIESGIDIPNANTLIIEGVENFGLSQLHQIREELVDQIDNMLIFYYSR